MRTLAILAALSFVYPARSQDVKDYTNTKPEELGVKFVEPAKDSKTGFIVGGKNSTALIRTLSEINGIKIETLERMMRPGKLSRLGFLGKDEKLLDVLAMDNDFVLDKLSLTHQDIGRHLHILGAIGVKQKKEDEFLYHGRKFKVTVILATGYQESPFEDETKSNANATILNVGTGKSLPCALLVPHMIERYGFYEGKGTPYRVDPANIVEVLDFLKKAASK